MDRTSDYGSENRNSTSLLLTKNKKKFEKNSLETFFFRK